MLLLHFSKQCQDIIHVSHNYVITPKKTAINKKKAILILSDWGNASGDRHFIHTWSQLF